MDEIKMIYLVIENKKVNFVHWLREFLPPTLNLPVYLHFKQLSNADTHEKPPTVYKSHTEFEKPFQPDQSHLNRKPPTVKPIQTHVDRKNMFPPFHSNDVLIHSPPNRQIALAPEQTPSDEDLMINDNPATISSTPQPMPQQEINLERRKRNILTPIFSYITGLASQDEVDKVFTNEQQILQAENSMVERIQTIQSQTNTIVDSIKEQNNKVATLYKDELAIKTSLRTLLTDTGNAL